MMLAFRPCFSYVLYSTIDSFSYDWSSALHPPRGRNTLPRKCSLKQAAASALIPVQPLDTISVAHEYATLVPKPGRLTDELVK